MQAFDEIAHPNKAGDSTKELARVLGLKSVVSMSLSAMAGSVLVLPGPAVGLTGASASFAIIVSGLCVLSASLSKSEIATAMPVSGGSYVYLAKAFGPMVGTMTGLGLWMSVLFKGAFGLAGFNEYISSMMKNHMGEDSQLEDWQVKIIGVGLLCILLAGNLAGLKKIKSIQKYYTLAAMVFLFFMIMASFSLFKNDAYEEHLFENGSEGFIECLGFIFIGYAGLTKICALASEIKSPEKNMPLAILFSLAVFTPFFCLAVTACLGAIKFKDLKKDYAPFHTLAYELGGNALADPIAIICTLAMIAMANVSLMAVARFPYAMALDGLIPPYFKYTMKSTKAPWVSLCSAAFVMGVAIVFLPVKQIAKLCSSFQLLVFCLEDLTLMIFRVGDEYWFRPTFRSPFFPFTQLFGMSAQFVMLCYMGMEGLIAVGGLIVVGFLLYRFYGINKARFIGVIRFEKCFNVEPRYAEPVKPHEERHYNHPISERDFETEIWEYEEDHGLPHEAHILQVEQLENEVLILKQENRRLKLQAKDREAASRKVGGGKKSHGEKPREEGTAEEQASLVAKEADITL